MRSTRDSRTTSGPGAWIAHVLGVCLLFGALAMSGCATPEKEPERERTAKDWYELVEAVVETLDEAD